MRHQEDRPRYWQQWLRDHGIADALERLTSQHYRAQRSASERKWTYAYVGAVAGAPLGVLASALYIGLATERTMSWPSVALVAVGAALAASIAWWIAYWSMHGSRQRSAAHLAAQYLHGEESYAHQVLETVADGLAHSEFRPRDERLEVDQLAQATMVTGLREAPTSELERNLLERLTGSAFVPTVDGSLFLFKLGPPCTRCATRTRTGPLRLLNVRPHWATELGYQRLKDLPPRSRRLLVVPQMMRELAEFFENPSDVTSPPRFFTPNAELLLCEKCGKEAIRRGVLRDTLERAR